MNNIKNKKHYGLPEKQGLYNPINEKDNCGVGFIANIKGVKSHSVVRQGIDILNNLEHRGAVGADPLTGDGAGILTQIPHKFFVRVCKEAGFDLPDAGNYGVGMMFLPTEDSERKICEGIIEGEIKEAGQELIGWRDVPVNPSEVGDTAREEMPVIKQVFIKSCAGGTDSDDGASGTACNDNLDFERKLYVIRRQMGFKIRDLKLHQDRLFHVPSLSSTTIVYKGQLMTHQVNAFFDDLSDEDFTSALALVHSRYSTNTFPSWDLAHPFRYMAHNGEINTLSGNTNWMFSRESMFKSELFGSDIEKIKPIIRPYSSDSFSFDNALELLYLAGRSLPHSAMMLIPEAWDKNTEIDKDKEAFYRFHANKMEPWDGPAAVAFTDGSVIGATLDRNGLRPARYTVTKDGFIIMGSEAGVLGTDPSNVEKHWRLQPGKMLVVDLVEGRIIDDEEVKNDIITKAPYREWVEKNRVTLGDLPSSPAIYQPNHATLLKRQKAFGFTSEDVNDIIAPMALKGVEPTGAMGNDAPVAVLSEKSQLVYNYFKQLFAQVTNPPVDPIREELVMSLQSYIGAEGNLLNEAPEDCHRLELTQPILTNLEMAKLHNIDTGNFKTVSISTLFNPAEGEGGLSDAVTKICSEADKAIKDGANIIVLSDLGVNKDNAPIPALMATGAVHHHLIKNGTRGKVGIVVESGEPRETHHFALLIGYGAGAINPYLTFETIADLYTVGKIPHDIEGECCNDEAHAEENYVKAIGKGLMKIFSKMGISTLQSYNGAQIFEAVGLSREVIDRFFTGTTSRIEGASLGDLVEESTRRHSLAYPTRTLSDSLPIKLDHGGSYKWRRDGELHTLNPEVIIKLQHSVRSNDYKMFKSYSKLIDDQTKNHYTIRGLFEFKNSNDTKNKSISIDEVESAESIMERFASGAMSYGSISREAHETIAIAMNRIGGRSNSGEGGEEERRFTPDDNGDLRRSAIKQVASGRFGVTSHYLVNADELQIKMAQGAKPGEGGQLPGHKVNKVIAKVRHSTPGVGLISPPPHHDIYSIEDLAQLIHDLKNSNDKADISVKLVSEVGVGTIAAGVSKGKAEKVLISGYDGGTGASPMSSVKHAGLPWELGLSETQQTLVLNGLRGRIRVQVDGQLRTGRDVVIGAMLGADEFGFATIALVAMGCIMLRKCHLNTCSVGIATQDEELRKKFKGTPDHVVNYFKFVAEEVREIMAELGFKKFEDMIGHAEFLDVNEEAKNFNGKATGLDLSPIFERVAVHSSVDIRNTGGQDHGLEGALDKEIIKQASSAIKDKKPVTINLEVRNINRTVGTMLGAEISRLHGSTGLPDDTITLNFTGTAGQSFGAFVPKGVTMILSGDANDYFCKGLSGGKAIVKKPDTATFDASSNIIAGNVILYGATSGEVFINGVVGERFCVRNSGATAVVEGVGDHGCEYMTGGRVVVLGETGRNFAAGMSGGIAYVYDEDKTFDANCNKSMVALETIGSEDPECCAEADFVKSLIEKHFKHTGSEKAKSILDNWSESVNKFVKVMPVEYRRVLDELRNKKVV